MKNSRVSQTKNSSGYKGVYFNKECRKWLAQIKVNGKSTYLGMFVSPHEAAHAYNKAAIQLHGEFAILNVPGIPADAAKKELRDAA